MKRALSLLVVAAMTLSMAACGPKPAEKAPEKEVATQETKKEEPKTEEAKKEEPKKEEAQAEPAKDVTELTFLMDWNGGAAAWPDGFNNGPVAKAVTEKTGVRLNVETITSSETEKLAMVFASGDVPDITNAPFWSTNPGGEGELIKKAAMEGMLLPLNSYLDKYPNLKTAVTEGVYPPFKENHLENKDFAGERYVIPRKAKTDADVTNWAYNVYARKDILASLNIDPQSVTDKDTLYALLKKIKDGGFKDINGKPVIPAGNWHNGWSYEQYTLNFDDGGYTHWDKIDGKMVQEVFNPLEIQKILYMRKLVSEGLYDAEALTQTDTVAKEKMVTGRVATFGVHFPHMNGFFKSNLYKSNPEMEFVPLGPFKDAKGENIKSYATKGANGFGCLFLSAKVSDPDKALGLVEYMSSDEGFLLAKYGIEGVHYNMKDGVPTRTEEWAKIKAEDATKYNLEGFGYGELTTDDSLKSKGWDPEYNEPAFVKARELRPQVFYDGKTLDAVSEEWPERAAYDEVMATTNYGDEKKKAISSASDEEATGIIEAYRKKMISAGYENMVKYVEEQIAADPKLLY